MDTIQGKQNVMTTEKMKTLRKRDLSLEITRETEFQLGNSDRLEIQLKSTQVTPRT